MHWDSVWWLWGAALAVSLVLFLPLLFRAGARIRGSLRWSAPTKRKSTSWPTSSTTSPGVKLYELDEPLNSPPRGRGSSPHSNAPGCEGSSTRDVKE